MGTASVAMRRTLTSSLPRFVAFWFATVLAGYHGYCTEIQRIYQNRISVINMGVDIETYEVVGLASVELESEMRPTYFFDCNTTENNGTGITWTRQSGEFRFRVEDVPSRTNGRRLTVSGITANDLGVYTCLDTYSNARVSINITQDNPAVQPINRVLRVMQGTNVTIAVYVSGYPLVTSEQIHWYRPNGTEIMEDGDFKDERRSLVISVVQLSDAGVYTCGVNTPYGSRRTTIQLDVYGSSPLKVYQGRIVSSDVEVFQVRGLATVEFDNSVTYYLDCNTLRNDGSGIMWMRVGGNNPFQVSDVGTGNGRRLSLSGVRDSDLGSYLCYDTLSEDRATINITTDNPAVSAVSRLVEVLEGDNAVLEVYVSSYPLVTSNHVSWYWPNGSKVTEEDGTEFMSDGRALFLVNVKPSEAGVYRCEVNVSTSGQRSSAIVRLNVYAQSVIISHPRMVSTATEWKTTTIQCDASGIPLPTITWEREGGVIPPTTTVLTYNDIPNRVTSVLMFNSVRYRDRGRYRCMADNSHTPQVKSDYSLLRVTPSLLLAINISGEPQLLQDPITVAEGSEVTLECTGSGSLLWTWSAGQEIPTSYEAPDNLYQEYINSREVQLLHIRNFSSSEVATYRCGTSLTTHGGAAVEIAVTLKGDTIASAQTTNPEPQLDKADSAAAVVGGVLSGIILAILVVLFMLVITLVVQRRTKGSAPVAGVEVESGDPVDNGVNLMSVQELKPEENNIQASDSIEKLNDNNSLETAAPTTDKMDEIL